MGSMVSIYNPPYYPRHMEQMGYEKEVDWVSFHIDVPKAVPDKFARVTSLVQKRFGLTFKKMTKEYIPIVDTRLFTGVEDREGRLVGVAITTHSLSNALNKSRGKLFPLGWYHLLRSLKWKHEGKVDLMLIAVHPDYQGMGVNALFFADLIPIYNELGITLAETGPQLEDNIKELLQWMTLNPRTVKRRRCYQKEIN